MRIVFQLSKEHGPKRPNTFDIIVTQLVRCTIIQFRRSLHVKTVFPSLNPCGFRFGDTNDKYKYRKYRQRTLCQNISHFTNGMEWNPYKQKCETNQICSFKRWWHFVQVKFNFIDNIYRTMNNKQFEFMTEYWNSLDFIQFCSVPTLLAYLRNFDASTDIYLGERYGYQLLSRYGFNYITGGAGIVFSLSVIEKLVESCRCPAPTSPDDMILALCLQRMDVEPMHSSRFHQVRLCHNHTNMVVGAKIIIATIF